MVDGMTKEILIVGGYGHVGQEVARRVARMQGMENRLVVAGRRLEHARRFADELGAGTRAIRIDVDAPPPPEVLERTGVVVMCVDSSDERLAEQCLRAGIGWVDVTAEERRLERLEALGPLARRHGSAAVLSVGVCPGTTNLLAAHARGELGPLRRVDLFLMLGAGDAHGQAAIEWTLENLGAAFAYREEGAWAMARGFGARAPVRIPGEARDRWGYRFNFPDQRVIARTLAIPSVSTWLLFDHRALTLGAALVARTGASRLLGSPRARRVAARAFGRLRFGSDACVVVACAESVGGERRSFALAGRREASLTGHVAAEVVRDVVAGRAPAGVHHLGEIAQPAEFLQRLPGDTTGVRLWL